MIYAMSCLFSTSIDYLKTTCGQKPVVHTDPMNISLQFSSVDVVYISTYNGLLFECWSDMIMPWAHWLFVCNQKRDLDGGP